MDRRTGQTDRQQAITYAAHGGRGLHYTYVRRAVKFMPPLMTSEVRAVRVDLATTR